MVYRLISFILITLASIPVHSIEFEYIDRQTLNSIRESARKDAFGNKLDGGITREQALLRKLYRTTNAKQHNPEVNAMILPDLALYSSNNVSIEQAISLISRAINYNFIIDDDINNSLKVALSKRYDSLDDVIDNIEYQTNTVIHVFKDSRIIFVTKV